MEHWSRRIDCDVIRIVDKRVKLIDHSLIFYTGYMAEKMPLIEQYVYKHRWALIMEARIEYYDEKAS